MITTLRFCPHCRTNKPPEEFAPNRNVKSGRMRICHPCDALKQAKYRTEKRQEINDRRKTAYQAPIRRSGETREEFIRRQTFDKYSLSAGEFHALLTQQGNACAICKEAFDLSDGYRNCHIDHVKHPHDTRNRKYGKVRGLLCNSCNNGIGRFRHDAERLRNAADYLEWHNENRDSQTKLGV
jgi:hypothetical protein